jgi:O-antigen/teichoic acid export membrane protein
MNRAQSNKRIVKNTGMLYIRMLVSMGVSLYTSRIVLSVLGTDNYGIYGVVGGIVIFFSFLNGAMASATQRFLNFELGRNDLKQVKQVFSMSMTVYILIALIALVLSETIGLWYLNTQMVIPPGRLEAANWAYQFSVLTFCIQVIRVPYEATIIAYERMSFYAYISIADVVFKLLVVCLLVFGDFDKLIYYAALNTGVVLLVSYLYKRYCNRTFTTARYAPFWDKKLYTRLMSFSGWSLLGSIANITTQQGGNLLLNLFYGVTVNASMGLANQVNRAVYGFVSSFQTAFNPAIVKAYAAGDKAYFFDLIFKASKYSYFLLFTLSLPVLLCCHFVMSVWLGQVPDYLVPFSRLMLLLMLMESAAAPLWISIQATGEIRNYQILMGSLLLLNLPLAYIALKMGFSPVSVLAVRVGVYAVVFMVRIFYLGRKIALPVRAYFAQVMMRLFAVTALSVPLPWLAHHYWSGWSGLLLTILSTLLGVGFSVYYFGLRSGERQVILYSIRRRLPFRSDNHVS